MTTAIYIAALLMAAAIAYHIVKLNRRYDAETKRLNEQRDKLDAYHAETMRINHRHRGTEIAELDCYGCRHCTCPHNPRGYDFNPNGFDPADPPEFDPEIEIEAGAVYCQNYEGV